MIEKKHSFIDFLNGIGENNALFEPIICRDNTESLIYRKSNKLWSTPHEYINTLISLAERIGSYFAFIDMHSFETEERTSLVSAAAEKKSDRG